MRDRPLSAMVIVPTTIVVLVFAGLQYRWSTQANETTGIRLADTLQLSLVNWQLDFLRNFSEICLIVRGHAGVFVSSDGARYARQLSEWRSVARYPDLVANVYVVTQAGEGGTDVLRLDATTGQFRADNWPQHFGVLHPALGRRTLAADPAEASVGADDVGDQRLANSYYNIGDALRGWRFDPDVPALLHPVARPMSTGEAGEAIGWIVIDLSDDVIRERILPDLAHRYFQGTDGLDYQVAVVGRDPREVIYTSDAGFGQEPVLDADGTVDIFGRVRDGSVGTAVSVFHPTSESRGMITPAAVSWFPLLREMPIAEDWQLVVRHRRGGPLGTFVADMRRRDLAVSFGALFLLAVSLGMLIVTSNRAQRMARLQVDFVAAVSHELRTPLAVIGSAADNIAQGVVSTKEQLERYGSVIRHQVAQLSGLVEQVLLFAATQDAPRRKHVRSLDLAEIIDATLDSTQELIDAAQFTVERDVDPNLPRVHGDLLALSQCLQNLVTNALKYGAASRWIGIRARLAKHPGGGSEVEVGVSDRGSGIASSDLPHIFEPFYRSPAATAAQVHGTGLGLSLARQIAEDMGGRLTVDSVVGQGSTFTLHLPCADGPESVPQTGG